MMLISFFQCSWSGLQKTQEMRINCSLRIQQFGKCRCEEYSRWAMNANHIHSKPNINWIQALITKYSASTSDGNLPCQVEQSLSRNQMICAAPVPKHKRSPIYRFKTRTDMGPCNSDQGSSNCQIISLKTANINLPNVQLWQPYAYSVTNWLQCFHQKSSVFIDIFYPFRMTR